jgi:hypothetical protein
MLYMLLALALVCPDSFFSRERTSSILWLGNFVIPETFAENGTQPIYPVACCFSDSCTLLSLDLVKINHFGRARLFYCRIILNVMHLLLM